MSVAEVMSTMAAAESAPAGEAPAGSTEAGKPIVKGVEDIFSLYADDASESPAEKNGVELKKDDKNIPDELNNTVPKQELEKEEKEDIKEDKPETSKDVIEESKSIPDMVKVKVNGVEKEVPLQDVINSYSGQQEIQRRFTEFDKTKKAFEAEKNELIGMNNYVKQEISDLRSAFEGVIGQYQKNGYIDHSPMAAVSKLLDKMGINSNLFERAVFEHNLPEYAKFFNMTDVERDAFYAKKENDYLRRKEQGFNERDQQVKLREERQRQDFELIKSAGLDSVKYDELSRELLDAGHKDLTAEKVVEYARQKPTLDKVVEVFNEIGSDPTKDERARTVFKILTEFPETTTEEILNHMDPQRAALKSAKVLNSKAPKGVKVQPQRNEDKEFDEMLAYYKN